MTPEQLKLLQQLAQMGDVSIINRSKENIIKAFEKMDLNSLNKILDENLTYQDVSKNVFLEKLNEIFIEIKKSDSKLYLHDGFCSSEECSNNGKKGVMFCGNNSGKHFNFIFEQNNDERVTDIFQCHRFECDAQNAVDENKKRVFMKIYDDEKANFSPSSDYLHKNNYSLNAVSELTSDQKLEITKDEIVEWVRKHKDFYDSLNWMSLNYKFQSYFYECYNHLSKINDFFNLEIDCYNALDIYTKNDMQIEFQLLKWLAEHEELHYKLTLLFPNIINENELKSGEINLYKDLNRYFKKDVLINCITVGTIFEKYYYDKLNKYRVENSKIEEVSPFDDEFDNYISLRYHLEQQNLFVDKFNYIPILGKNSFLYDAPEFTMMENGVNLDSQSFNRDISLNDKGNEDFKIT